MSIDNKIKGMFGFIYFKNVKISPIETAYERNTDTVWFENHNIEACIRAVKKLGIEHIHLQTNTIDFLADPRLMKIKGVSIQYEIKNIEPLFNLEYLTHLGLPENIQIEFDFSRFKNLIFLGGFVPKKYKNIHQLLELKYVSLSNYRKPNLIEFSQCKQLIKVWMYSVDIENLSGLSNLTNLIKIDLENCRKLVSLDGIATQNISLQNVRLINCKKLKNADALANLPNLTQLQLYEVHELYSLKFLYNLNSIENLYINPKKVGVQNQDYYPLVETLKKLDKLAFLKGWKPLNSYLNKEIVIESVEEIQKSDLDLIKENIDIMSWTEKKDEGLEQYTKKNCKTAQTIILKLINQLENVEQSDFLKKEELIRECVLELNKFNETLDGSFIETGEREELCDLFDNIADAVGLNVQDYPDGVASKWRDW